MSQNAARTVGHGPRGTVPTVAHLASTDVQVYFLFDRSGQWPPVPSEGLRAQAQGNDCYLLMETPFFVRNVAMNDVVRAEDDGSGVLWAGERVTWGGHQSLRVTPRSEGLTPTTCAQVQAEFAALGLTGEELEEYSIVALDVPPGMPEQAVKDLLVTGAQAHRWWYEEACIGPNWPATR